MGTSVVGETESVALRDLPLEELSSFDLSLRNSAKSNASKKSAEGCFLPTHNFNLQRGGVASPLSFVFLGRK